MFPSLMFGTVQRFGFPPSTQHLQKPWSTAVEKTRCSHTFLKFNIHTCLKLFISLIPSHLHRKTPLTALVTTAGEDPQKCRIKTHRCSRRRPPDMSSITARKDSPRWSLGLCSALPAPQPTIPGILLQPGDPRAPSWPRALAHMFAHAGTEREGKAGCRNNTGTQTKEHKPLIWVNQRK